MQPLSASLFYEPDINTFDRVTDRRLGGDSTFDLPFSLFSHEVIWTNRVDTAWVFNRSLITFHIQEGLEYYAVDTDRFKWGPYVSAALDRNDTDSEGGESSILSFGQKVITEQITWTGNYRTGYLANVRQSFDYNLPQKIWSVSVSVESQVHKAFSYMGISTRQYAFYNTNGIRLKKQGVYVRGIRDTDIRTDIFDFEMQLSPFVDVSVGHNYETGSYFNPKDGWYGCGIEILGYLNKWRSIQGRVSLGFDAAQLLEKTDTRNRFAHDLFNTDWRTGPLYELNIGIGLFY